MFKLLRNKKTQKRIWIILCVVILPPFVLWGAGSLMHGQKQNAPHFKIFGRSVSESELNDSIEAVRNQAIIQFGDNFTEMQKFLNLEAQAMERLILLSEAKKRKIKVNDKEVVDFIEGFPLFQNKGQFDTRVYSSMLRYVFHTLARAFEEQSRQNIMLEKLFELTTKDVLVSAEEIKEGYRKENEQISVYYIASVASDFAKEVTASEEEIKEYFTKNSLSFKQPLSFNIEYILLDAPEKRTIVISRLGKKEDFHKIAKDLSLQIKETGLFNQLTPIPGIGWSPEILNIITKSEIGKVTTVQIDKNYYAVSLKEKKEPYIPEINEIKDKVKDALVKDKSLVLAKQKITQCLAMLKDTTTLNPKAVDFDKAAKALGLKSSSTDLFKYSSYIENIGASDEFYNVARTLKDDEFSGIITTPAGFYIIRVKLRVVIDETKFQSEKEAFRKKLLEQKKQESFAKFYNELKRKALGF